MAVPYTKQGVSENKKYFLRVTFRHYFGILCVNAHLYDHRNANVHSCIGLNANPANANC